MNNHSPIITVTTDFQGDYSSAQMEGVIRSINRDLIVVRATDQITPFNVREGSFVLWDLARAYPADAIHIGVIDPGVGTDRPVIALQTNHGSFVGPDNGLFDIVAERFGVVAAWCYPIRQFSERFGSSKTFHGRDVFTRIAVDLATHEIDLEREPIAYAHGIHTDPPIVGSVPDAFHIIHIDGFGNLKLDRHTRFDAPHGLVVTPPRHRFPVKFVQTFHQANIGELVAYLGSSEVLEIAVVNQSAEEYLEVSVGDRLEVTAGVDRLSRSS